MEIIFSQIRTPKHRLATQLHLHDVHLLLLCDSRAIPDLQRLPQQVSLLDQIQPVLLQVSDLVGLRLRDGPQRIHVSLQRCQPRAFEKFGPTTLGGVCKLGLRQCTTRGGKLGLTPLQLLQENASLARARLQPLDLHLEFCDAAIAFMNTFHDFDMVLQKSRFLHMEPFDFRSVRLSVFFALVPEPLQCASKIAALRAEICVFGFCRAETRKCGLEEFGFCLEVFNSRLGLLGLVGEVNNLSLALRELRRQDLLIDLRGLEFFLSFCLSALRLFNDSLHYFNRFFHHAEFGLGVEYLLKFRLGCLCLSFQKPIGLLELLLVRVKF
mmetsp:Transcript_25793/g.64444  ORF Transcript_25793/g.64444 Transcript_25793/m.64444 type:complete len:325 (+) Transcript_25793:700-1674(+)